VRVDRLDVWKNLIRGFQALELLLEREPALLAELWFCAILAPPRRPTERSIRYRAECEAVVDRINERFGSIPGQLAGGSIVGTTLADAVAAS
jgi:trehalose 6-phosphate synthase